MREPTAEQQIKHRGRLILQIIVDSSVSLFWANGEDISTVFQSIGKEFAKASLVDSIEASFGRTASTSKFRNFLSSFVPCLVENFLRN
jgi:hypothetical protein